MSERVFIGNNYCPWAMIEGQELCPKGYLLETITVLGA